MSLLDKASLCVTPNGYKENILYSVVPNTTLGDMNVVRATTATRVNSSGLIEVVPRNLVTYSNTFSNAAWTKGSTITLTGGQTGYDATNNAWLLSKGAIQYPTIGQSVSNSGTKTLSVYAKANTNTKICLFASASPSNFYQDFDLSNGTLGPNSFGVVSTLIENVGNGWYRCSVVFNGTTTDFNIFPDDILGDNAGSVFIQNAQIESGLLTEYFPTTTRLNIPRIDYTNGSCPSLLVEPQRTNFYPYSQQLNQWSILGSVTITENNEISPDGTQNADRAQFSLSTDLLYRSGTGLAGSNTLTVYAKAKSGTSQNFRFFGNGGLTYSSNQVATNQWQRFTFTYTYSAQTAGLAGATTGASDVLFYGFQHEIGSYPTTYIPTLAASSVTRNADVISKTGISSLIGQTEGTVFCDVKFNDFASQSINPVLFSLFGNARIYMQVFTSGYAEVIYSTGAGTQAYLYWGGVTNGRHKIALAYKQNDFVLYIDGVQIATDTNGVLDTLNSFYFGYDTSNLNPTAYYNSAQLYKTRLTNSELASLTTL
jgi:hypothetical protein